MVPKVIERLHIRRSPARAATESKLDKELLTGARSYARVSTKVAMQGPDQKRTVITLEELQHGARAVRERFRNEAFPHVLTIEGEVVAEIAPIRIDPEGGRQRQLNQAAIATLDEWVAVDDADDEDDWALIKERLQENRRKTGQRLLFRE